MPLSGTLAVFLRGVEVRHHDRVRQETGDERLLRCLEVRYVIVISCVVIVVHFVVREA